ncbi:ATP-binding protein [Sebaldella sp. S0638]|uniref:ATP-binding protein n=1 Tax=Sebaldella sp. S0638 TaxID=2957809 RepID=UPI0020A108C4|nr:DUF87 domain-containing protein [Sebaldella sp. S0638]MCP1224705.1 DUF853 family protein [Sebaldella sp. S0638]
MSKLDYEKLGSFYLGKKYNFGKKELTNEYYLYDSKDLTTHGLCVGMTGSGKTELCLSLIEEAAIDGIPVIAIDPKGDLGNLMLSFPDLKPEDFLPWVSQEEADKKGMTLEDYAKSTAELWKNGLQSWDEDGERIKLYKDSSDVVIYTPGSKSGIPVTALKSFDVPAQAVMENTEALNEKIQTTVSGILSLIGIEADPLQSREHILISNILSHAWAEGKSLTLADLIRLIQQPQFSSIGVFDLESFFPQKDRMGLSVKINSILASPSFSVWLEGESLDIGKFLYTKEGKPKISIFSIAHLSDKERMFFVTMLLNELVAWMRTQQGTSSLRALFYMDEIFGYFPPVSNPPSKQPMLTLLKQARAFGLGVMLATQNPVDIDYKGLSNIGTWFIGRLQTERDKSRMIEGLRSINSEMDKGGLEDIISGLESRTFLASNANGSNAEIFQTRWALNYLRGPITKPQIEILMKDKKAEHSEISAAVTAENKNVSSAVQGNKPVLPQDVKEVFFQPQKYNNSGGKLIYKPFIYGEGKAHYVKASDIDVWDTGSFLIPMDDETAVFNESEKLKTANYISEADSNFSFESIPASISGKNAFSQLEKGFKQFLYESNPVNLFYSKDFKTYSAPEEDEGTFRGRLSHLVREKKDAEVEKIREKYSAKMDTQKEKIRKLGQNIDKEKEQYNQKKMTNIVDIGTTLFGAFLGKKKTVSTGRAATALRGLGRTGGAKADVERAQEEYGIQNDKLKEMEAEFQKDIDNIQNSFNVDNFSVETVSLPPRKTDITVQKFFIAWVPYSVNENGEQTRLL